MLERALRICPSATGVVLASDVGADPPRKRYGVVLIEGFHSPRPSSTSPDGVTDSQPIVRRDGHSVVTFGHSVGIRWLPLGIRWLPFVPVDAGAALVTASFGGDSCTDSSGCGSCRSSAKRMRCLSNAGRCVSGYRRVRSGWIPARAATSCQARLFIQDDTSAHGLGRTTVSCVVYLARH